jgi:hypothetical protein
MKRLILSMFIFVLVVFAVVAILMVTQANAAVKPSEAQYITATFCVPHHSQITGAMIMYNHDVYGVPVAAQLAILTSETSLGDPRTGGRLVGFHNYGCMKFGSLTSYWGQLAYGYCLVGGIKWYAYRTPALGMESFGRLLQKGQGGYYLRALQKGDLATFSARYYGNVPGESRYLSGLKAHYAYYASKLKAAGYAA